METEKNMNVENTSTHEEYVTFMGLKVKKTDYDKLMEASRNNTQTTPVSEKPKTLFDIIKERGSVFNIKKEKPE
jgi:hypothetical protein